MYIVCPAPSAASAVEIYSKFSHSQMKFELKAGGRRRGMAQFGQLKCTRHTPQSNRKKLQMGLGTAECGLVLECPQGLHCGATAQVLLR